MDKIEERLRYIVMNDFFNCIIDDKELFIQMKLEAHKELLTTDKSIIEIEQELNKKYNINIPYTQTRKDFVQVCYLFRHNLLNMTKDELKKRFTDDPKGVEERMLFRIELYKAGWDEEQIERYIYKHMLKEDFVGLSQDIYDVFYNNYMRCCKIYKTRKEKSVGRPSLPSNLKEHVKTKHYSKVKDNMRKIYKSRSLVEDIKNSLLTEEEIRRVEDLFEDKFDPVLLKIKNLYIRDI